MTSWQVKAAEILMQKIAGMEHARAVSFVAGVIEGSYASGLEDGIGAVTGNRVRIISYGHGQPPSSTEGMTKQ